MEKNKKNNEENIRIPDELIKELLKEVPKLIRKPKKELGKNNEQNFIEVETVEEANQVDLTRYSFIGIKQDKYVFKIRQR